MFSINEQLCDSFVSAIKESFQSGTPILQLIAEIDAYKDKGIVEWYAVDKGNHGITFKLAGTDRRFRLGEKGLAPVNAVPPENPETVNAPQHIRKAMAPACSCQESNDLAEKADLKHPWHSIFGELHSCSDCGAILGKGKTKCRYCEDRMPTKLMEGTGKPEEPTDILPIPKPCPVCGGSDIILDNSHTKLKMAFKASCAKCCIQTEWKDSPEIAIDTWNNRSRLDYADYVPNPCPICGAKTSVDVKYPNNDGTHLPALVVSKVICTSGNCVTVSDAGVPPHMGVIPRWNKLTAPFSAPKASCEGNCNCGCDDEDED